MRTLVAVACAAFCVTAVTDSGHAQNGATLTPAFDTSEWLASNSPITFRVNGGDAPGTGALAVFIGSVDVSALLRRDGDVYRYDPELVRLPAGEHEVVVYRVTGSDAWSELGRIPIRVLTPGGFERIDYDPLLAVENAGQIAQGHSLDQLAPDRDTYQDFTFRAGFSTQHARPALTVRSQLNTVGASNRAQALRFGTERDDAPKFDLADFLVRAEVGPGALSFGHVAAGTHRHLISGLASRGVALHAGAGPVFATLAALNGSSIVGWSNPSGLGQDGHRVLSGEIGVEAFPARPGMLRMDATFVDGSVLPRTGFSQGAIVDAETSRGMGVQLSAMDPSGRVRFNGSLARSEFDNVEDVTLTRGNTLVIIRDETREARRFDLSVDVLRGVRLGSSTLASLSTSVRHERVDPLYRSVAAFTQSDLEENGVDVTATIGPFSARWGHSRRSDNLDDIPSILTTQTRLNELSLAMPLGWVIGQTGNAWLPQLSYTLNRVHQFGEGVPGNGGFSASHIPDQLSAIHGVAAQWYHAAWQFVYRFDRSTQDNRQQGRQNADFERTAHTATLGLTPWRRLQLAVDASNEEAVSEGIDETSEVRRLGANATVQLAGRTALTLFGSQSWTTDPFDGGAECVIRQMRLEFSQGVSLWSRTGGAATGRLFVRFAHQRGDLFGLAGTGAMPSAWTVNTGFNFSLF